MKQNLKKSVQDHVESQQLTNEQLQSLTQMINSNNQPPQSVRIKFKVIAAVLVLSLTLGIFFGFEMNYRSDVSQLIAEEVSINHLKMKPVEVSSNSINDVRAYFSQLDFSLSQSRFVEDNHLQLIGGRYCSIQGESAAQLRMRDKKTGNIQIVYQAPYNKKLFRELPKLKEGSKPVRHFVNGIGVDVWVEKGILFARSFEQ